MQENCRRREGERGHTLFNRSSAIFSRSAFAPKEYYMLIQLPWRSWQRVGLIILRSQVRALQGADVFLFVATAAAYCTD